MNFESVVSVRTTAASWEKKNELHFCNDRGLLLTSAETREKHIRNCIEKSYSPKYFSGVTD